MQDQVQKIKVSILHLMEGNLPAHRSTLLEYRSWNSMREHRHEPPREATNHVESFRQLPLINSIHTLNLAQCIHIHPILLTEIRQGLHQLKLRAGVPVHSPNLSLSRKNLIQVSPLTSQFKLSLVREQCNVLDGLGLRRLEHPAGVGDAPLRKPLLLVENRLRDQRSDFDEGRDGDDAVDPGVVVRESSAVGERPDLPYFHDSCDDSPFFFFDLGLDIGRSFGGFHIRSPLLLLLPWPADWTLRLDPIISFLVLATWPADWIRRTIYLFHCRRRLLAIVDGPLPLRRTGVGLDRLRSLWPRLRL